MIDVARGATAPLVHRTIPRVCGEVVVAGDHLFAVTVGGVADRRVNLQWRDRGQ
ncbi:MAG TPA: hypothetical protein PKW35_18485 [Nannocystaceae bacterium]|nr:hypothetical protein [Nannocystaceae bacterium]